jgi:hypothetical protein
VRIEITKRADGSGVLRCTRADGSVTWQKQTERHAVFFSLHDLTHYAVETTLGLRRGFFGLLSEGWDIDETDGKSARGPLPREAMEAEAIVGMLDGERASRTEWTPEDLQVFEHEAVRRLTQENLAKLRAARARLFERWAEVPVGGVLELEF